MIEEKTPATAERGLDCLKALQHGIDISPTAAGNAVEGVCGCGHPIVARSWEGAHQAMAAHFSARMEQ